MACRVEDCRGEEYLRHGYCVRHWRNMNRHGFPETVEERAIRGLRDAANAYEPGASVAPLVIAAVRWASRRYARLPSFAERCASAERLVSGLLESDAARDLSKAAWAYTEYDAEAPLAGFELASRRLEKAALDVFRALPATMTPANEPVAEAA